MDTRYGRFDSFQPFLLSFKFHVTWWQIMSWLNCALFFFGQGEKECSYYLKTGQCKFGITCKFHHPQPAGTSLPASAPQFYQQVQSPTVPLPDQYGGASTSLRVARPPILPGSYVQGAYGPVLLSPGVVPFPGWSPYSVREKYISSEIWQKARNLFFFCFIN